MKVNYFLHIAKALQIGWEIAFILGASIGLTYWLDHLWGTTPLMMIIGILAGIVITFIRFLKVGQ